MRWRRWTGAIIAGPLTAAGWGIYLLAHDWITLVAAAWATCCWAFCIGIGLEWFD